MYKVVIDLEDPEYEEFLGHVEDYFPDIEVADAAWFLARVGRMMMDRYPDLAQGCVVEMMASLAVDDADRFGERLPRLDGKGWV